MNHHLNVNEELGTRVGGREAYRLPSAKQGV